MGKRNGAILLAVLSIVGGVWPMVGALAGVMPAAGSSALVLVLLVNTTVVTTLGIATFILYSSMIADVVEDSALRTGRRSEGLFFAAHSLVQKSVTGFGVFLSGALLAAVHFPAHASPGTVAPGAVRALVLLYAPLTVFVYACGTMALCAYQISRDGHEANLRDLAEAGGAPAPVV